MAGNNPNGKGLTHFTPALDVLLAKYGPMTAVIYGYIWGRSQGERKRCDSNRATIKKRLRIDEKTFTTHARKLARDGYVRFQERGNASTIYWPTGKAEIENANFSVEIFPTKRDGSDEILPTSEENLPDGEENLPSQQGNFPHKETIYETPYETLKEKKKEKPSSSILKSTEEHPAIMLWMEVVKPGRLSEKVKAEIIDGLGDTPVIDDLQKAVSEWQEYARGKTSKNGKPYSLNYPAGIIEKYQVIASKPKPLTYKIDWDRLMVCWSDGKEIPINDDGSITQRGGLNEGYTSAPICPALGCVDYRQKDDGSTTRIERTKDNHLIVRDVQEGDRKFNEVYRNGKWVLQEGIIHWTPKFGMLRIARAKGGKVSLSEFRIVRNGEWVNGCTREEAERYLASNYAEYNFELVE